MILEICVDSLESAKAAQGGGAQRVELCSSLSEGGLTPSAGLLSAVREALNIPVYAMVRPRGGDFLYTPDEFRTMRKDIQAAAEAGADGVVLGVLHEDGRVDEGRTGELVALAGRMGVTFHRAIDWAPDLADALEQVIATGAERVLTSGGMPTAVQAVDQIAGMVSRASQRIRVMVCGHIRKGNVAEIAHKTGAQEFHASLRVKTASPVTYRNAGLHLGDANVDEFARYGVSAEDVQALSQALAGQSVLPAK